MARGISRAALIAAALAAPAAAAPAPPPAGVSPVLVRFSFDDEEPVTGPDALAVFEHARGRVRLSREIVKSGWRSVALEDVAGDGDFPELQGFFPQRRAGILQLSFALLVTDPAEELNVALAGPAGFRLGRDGIALWLATRGGDLVHVSDSIPKRLVPLDAFVWYGVEARYRVEAGRYDLTIRREGSETPVVALRDQPNAARQPGSAVQLFSFIGDDGDDRSNVAYFVDDVLVAAEPGVKLPPFVAPGRRRFFVDALEGDRDASAAARERGLDGDAEALLGRAAADTDDPRELREACEGVFRALLLERRATEAGEFAELLERRSAGTPEAARWIELQGDAAFVAGELDAADALYQRALALDPGAAGRLWLKQSDVAFRRGDSLRERLLREALFGALREP